MSREQKESRYQGRVKRIRMPGPEKPFEQMTPQEYEAYLTRSGMGGRVF